MLSTPNPKLCLMKSSMHEEKWFLVSNVEAKSPFSNISNLFKFGSNLKDIQVIAHIVHTFSHILH